jgi:hypothetical protein
VETGDIQRRMTVQFSDNCRSRVGGISGGQRGVVGGRLSVQMSNSACVEVKEQVDQYIWNNQRIRID